MRNLVRIIQVVSLGLVLSATAHSQPAGAPGDEELKSEEARLAYTLGRKMGTSIKNQQLDVEREPFLRGLHDVFMDVESQVPEEEMTEILKTFRVARKEKVRKAREKLAADNLRVGEEFLAENAKKEDIVVLPSGLQYRVLESGDGKQPAEKDKVSINYRANLIDGTEVGNTFGREVPFSFQLESAIPGQVEALKLMHAGDKWQLFIPTELAYGERGRPGLIGPNEALIFEVELLSVGEPDTKPAVAGRPPAESEAKN